MYVRPVSARNGAGPIRYLACEPYQLFKGGKGLCTKGLTQITVRNIPDTMFINIIITRTQTVFTELNKFT